VFFFQAEDGIRDRNVTGVQTCALPISDGQQETTETYRTEVSVPMEQIRIGVPFTFEIPIPADVASSYRGTYSYYSYVLHVGLDIAWGFDIIAQTPIVIVR